MRHSLPLAVALAACVLHPGSAGANGGPHADGIVMTGDGTVLASSRNTEVSILQEDLQIDLHQEFAEVRLKYRMRNAEGAVEQPFFFPVESWTGDVERYTIAADGSALPVVTVDAKGTPAKVADAKETDDFAPVRRWRRSVIPFGPGQTREIAIAYRSRYADHGSDVSDDTRREPRFFAYRFSPAGAWKDPIGRGRVVVNALLPQVENVRITAPNGRFRQTSPTRWEWSFEKLRPTQADDLRIVTEPASIAYGRTYPLGEPANETNYAEYRIVGNKAFLDHTIYEATASSVLTPSKSGQTYGPENMRKRYGGEHAWAEGTEGDGIGESVTLTVTNPLPLAALLVFPGFHHSEKKDLWSKNNRVASAQITLNGEHTFQANFPDEVFREPYPVPVRGYDKPVRTVKLVIKSVHRGSAYRDTCISYLGLRARLAKKPEIQGAR
ncbi:MAG: hypothetical protein JSR82_07665 [Verrucomicrobia bacterium]|nr:hypothetical protein [Verrucomicrobiota bacterium]